MNSEQRKKLVEDTLNSLDGMERAEPQPFLYTRLTARLQRAPSNFWERSVRYLSRPVVAVACLLLVLAANGFALINRANTSSEQTELLADDYSGGDMNANASVFFDMDK